MLRLIGSGGMGDVYEAEHLVLARPVALKVLKPALAADDTVRERFLREPRLAAAIRHPNIVPILDAGEADGRPYIAMEYIEGATLRVLLDERGRLPPARAIVMLRDVAAALDAAHEDGLVHRDVKPANILIDRNDTVILTDFGVAKDMTSTQATTVGGSFFGTPDYAPPEQFEGGSVDARSDLYSLGCVAVECLTGAIPFDAHSGLQAFVAHVQEEPPSASERVPGLGKEIDAVIARALAKQPDERYESCGQFVEAASAALAVTSGTAAARSERPPGGRRWPSITRKRSIVLAATALIVALAAGVGGALVANGGSGDDPASAASAEPTQTAPEPAAAPPEPGPPVAITEPAPGPASAADAASPAAGPDETDRRVAPAPEPDPAPTPAPVDDAILATSFAGGLTLGDGPEAAIRRGHLRRRFRSQRQRAPRRRRVSRRVRRRCLDPVRCQLRNARRHALAADRGSILPRQGGRVRGVRWRCLVREWATHQ